MFALLFLLSYSLEPPNKLMVDYRECSNEPLVGVDNVRPSFTFKVATLPTRGELFKAYQIRLSEGSKLVWDSGRVLSNHSSQIRCGVDLKSESRYTWTAQFWSSYQEEPSAQSKPCAFETGVRDWGEAVWIGHKNARVLQWRFNISSTSTTIRAYVASPGGHVVRLNGNENKLDRGFSAWTRFDKTVMYTAHALSSSLLLNDSENIFEVELGNGFWGRQPSQWPFGNPTALINLVIGNKKIVSSSNGWRGAVVRQSFDDPFFGATLDWRKTNVSWTTDVKSTYHPDSEVKLLSLNRMPMAGVVDYVNPISATKLHTGSIVVKFPRMFVGYARIERLAITGPVGSTVKAVHGELLLANGSCCYITWNAFKPRFQTDIHILGEVENEPMAPLFTWYGFQYVELRFSGGAAMTKKAIMDGGVLGVVTNMNMQRVGRVSFSGGVTGADKILSQLEVMTMNGLHSNLVAYLPTDCPTREKKGWLGDSLNTVDLAMMTLWTPAIHSFFLDTMIVDTQEMNTTAPNYGWIPDSVPSAYKTGKAADLSWTSAFPLISHHMLMYYNDTNLIASIWERLSIYVDSMTEAGKNEVGGLADFFQFGDWSANESRSIYNKGTGPVLAAANYLMSLKAMAEMADAIGKTKDASKYSNLYAQLSPVFHSRFWTPATKSYNHNDSLETQSLNSIALGAGLVPKEYINEVQSSLKKDVTDRGFHLTVGATGAMYLLQALNSAGDSNAAMRVATQTTEPSWGWWLTQNATTCWEDWSGVKDPTHPPQPTHNHIFLCGGLGSWLYQYLGGVRPIGHGYSVAEIAPETGSTLGPDRVDLVVETIRGQVQVSWFARSAVSPGVALELAIEIPSTMRAIVRVPVANTSMTIIEGILNQPIWSAGKFIPDTAGVEKGYITDENKITFEVSPGKYQFVVETV